MSRALSPTARGLQSLPQPREPLPKWGDEEKYPPSTTSVVPVRSAPPPHRSAPLGRNRGSRSNVPNRGNNGVLKRSNKGKKGRGRVSQALSQASDVAYIAEKAWTGVKAIARLINVEEKVFDLQTFPTMSTSGFVYNLSNIAEGSDYNQRAGLSILAQHLYVGIRVVINASASTGSVVRVLIFADNDQRGADPAVLDVLEIASTIAPILRYTSKRFTVISDQILQISLSTSDVVHRQTHTYNRHINYSASTGADSSNWEGALFALVITDAATNVPSAEIYTRLLYTDN